MSRRQTSRTSVNRARLDRHLAGCAALAAGTVVLGAAGQANASIVYSGVQNVPMTATGNVYINFTANTTGTASTTSAVAGWDAHFYNFTYGGYDYLYMAAGRDSATNAVTTKTVQLGSTFLANLTPGTSISSSTVSSAGSPILSLWDPYNSPAGPDAPSAFNGVTGGLIGLSFVGDDGLTHDGWVRVNVSDTAPYTLTVIDWAYDTSADTPILAGATATVPEPASVATLGTLALGALGIRRNRRKVV